MRKRAFYCRNPSKVFFLWYQISRGVPIVKFTVTFQSGISHMHYFYHHHIQKQHKNERIFVSDKRNRVLNPNNIIYHQ